MKQNKKSRVIIFLLLFVMIGTSFTQVLSSKTISAIDDHEGRRRSYKHGHV